jgi:hypothetical protein
MIDKLYTVEINIDIEGICYQQYAPSPTISINDVIVRSPSALIGPELLNFELALPEGEHELTVVFNNKQYMDYPVGSDVAVLITGLRFQHIDSDFRLYGKYYPEYPEPWATSQRQLGNELPISRYSHYLGWNGIWKLRFCTPIYPWIHKTLNLGWML